MKRKNVCAHLTIVEGAAFRMENMVRCENPAVVDGQHGWLCAEHRKQEEQNIAGNLFAHRWAKRTIEDPDDLIVQGVIQYEARAIAAGVRSYTRFGSLEPVYQHYWQKA